LLLTVIGHSPKIDCEPARVWGCPTPAIRVYRRDAKKAQGSCSLVVKSTAKRLENLDWY
jgi:hypothetical protein